ncbi:MAG: immunoglobulin domain-containing protein [Verrucomicrobia bacterium]|nr:immunoglobulin domain-containing protein [Verrucomicrobiota bacterium]
MLLMLASGAARAEVVFQDTFTGPAGSITNSAPEIDLLRKGWLVAGGTNAPSLSGDGTMVSPAATNDHFAAINLLPVGPQAVISIRANVEVGRGNTNWIALGFGDGVHALQSNQSGPTIQLNGAGQARLFAGSGLGASTLYTVTNDARLLTLEFIYDSANSNATLLVNGQTLFNAVPVSHSLGTPAREFVIVQFSDGATGTAGFAVHDVLVDWMPRPRPLLSLPITDVLLVSSYGAVTNDNLDDTVGIQNALNAAKTLAQTPGKFVELRFEPGEYTIAAPGTNALALGVTNVQNLWVNGNGAQIRVTNPSIGFLLLRRWTNCVIEGFTIDYDPLTWVEGDVIQINSNASGTNIVIDVRPGFPAPTNDYVANASQRYGTLIETNIPGRWRENSYIIYNTGVATLVGGFTNRFQIQTDSGRIATIHTNDLWIQYARYNGSPLFQPIECTRLTFKGLTHYAASAGSIAGQLNSDLGVINCQVRIKPGRSKSSNADGVTPPGFRGMAPWIEGCVFEGVGDDVMNLRAAPYAILQTNVGGLSNVLQMARFGGAVTSAFTSFDFYAGNRLSFFDPSNGIVSTNAFITSYNTTNQTVTFDRGIFGVVTGATLSATCIYNDTLNSSAVVVSNQFLGSRRYGVLCRINNSLIAGNTFTGQFESAIAIRNDHATFIEGGFPTNVLITRNAFSEAGNDYDSITTASISNVPAYATISIFKARLTNVYFVTGDREYRDIRIIGNTFDLWRRAAIRVMNGDGVEVSGNVFGVPKTNFATPSPGLRIVEFQYSDNLTVMSNQVCTLLAGTTPIILSNCTGVATNAAFFCAGSPPIITTQPESQAIPAGGGALLTVATTGFEPQWIQWNSNATPIAGATNRTLALNALSTNAAGPYQAVISNFYGATSSVPAQLTVVVPPVVSVLPASQTVAVGSNVLLNAAVTSAVPAGFQWQFNSGDLANETNSTLARPGITTNQGGNYRVIADNLAGIVTSAVATVTVLFPPGITNQPVSINATAGNEVTFAATATGSGPLSYQWRFNGTNIADATNQTYSISGVQAAQAGYYSVVVSNAVGSALSGSAALWFVLPQLFTTAELLGGVRLDAPVGANFLVQVATNLAAVSPWTTLTNFTLTTNSYPVQDAQSAQKPVRLYRVMLQP